VIPRFRSYAPGSTRPQRLRWHAVDVHSGRVMGSLTGRAEPDLRRRVAAAVVYAPVPLHRGDDRAQWIPGAKCSFYSFRTGQRLRKAKRMEETSSADIGASYGKGGITTHRFLDGHPELFGLSFAIAARYATRRHQLSFSLPVSIRGPSSPFFFHFFFFLFSLLDATPNRNTARSREECKVRSRTPQRQ